MRTGLRLGLGGGVLLLALVYVATSLEVTTDITHFLPAAADRRLATISRAVADSALTRTMILSIGGEPAAARREAAAALAERLGRSPRVAWVQRGPEPGSEEAVRRLYVPRRLAFLAGCPGPALDARLSDEGLRESARDLKRQLALPSAPLVRALAAEDPLLAFPALLARLRGAQAGSLHLESGQLVTEEGRAIVFVGSRARAFDSTSQAALLDEARRAFDEVDRAAGGGLDLRMAAAARFAVSSERAIKADITRIAVVSTLGIVLLFLGFLRSPRALLLVALPLVAGVAVATATGLLLFGRLHGVTLAFGATLIGVCIDYAVHLLTHHAVAPDPAGPDGTLRRIGPALALGALTTVAGLSTLAWTSLPGVRELAVFAATGVAAALGATALLLPPLVPRVPSPPRAQLRAAAALGRLVAAMEARRRPLLALPLAALVLCAAGLPRLRWVDDVSALNRPDPAILAEDSAVRSEVSQMDAGRMVLALGRDEEAALRRNDLVAARLAAAEAAGEVEGHRSVHAFLPSAESQRRCLEAVRASPRLFDRVRAALEAEGFRGEAFEPFRGALEAEPPPPLGWEDLAASPLAGLVRPYRIAVGDEVAFLTFLRGVRDPAALARRLEGLDDVVYFDQLAFLGETYGNARARTLTLMALGLVAVFLLVLVRYRRLGRALAAFLPALLAAATTLAVVAALGVPANLLHLLGLLLVLSMGVDYGVFMVESRGRPEELGATALGLVVACLSTVLAFGLLAMSDNPALRAMGLTTGLGVLLSLLLAPTALALLAPRKTKEGRPS